MMKRHQRTIALVVNIAFMTLLAVYAMPLPAARALGHDEETLASAGSGSNFVEKEQQAGYQGTHKNSLPILLGIVAAGVAVLLLVVLISKPKYDVTGVWDFHNSFTTAGNADYDSVWTFVPYDDLNRVIGKFERNAGGVITKGQFTVVNKKDVVFQDDGVNEQFVGHFDSKTTMSGTFIIASGAKGNWTAKKK
jgi:hypothetical protein